jgi:hypothetical protein
MNFTPLDGERWTVDDYDRARTGLAARAGLPECPKTGDIIDEPFGSRTRLWIVDYGNHLSYSCGEDPGEGFIVNTDGSVRYTGTSGMRRNRQISLRHLTRQTTATATFWLDRMDDTGLGDFLWFNTTVDAWLLDEPPF